MNKNPQRSGFTLIELLVVISIIALLAGLAFPALQGALEAAQKAQASTMCNQLAIACTMYNTEYGVWPAPSATDTSGKFDSSSKVGDLCYSLNGCRELGGTSTAVNIDSATVKNSRGIQFMSFNKKDLKPGSTREIISPYKKPSAANRIYKVFVDGDYDGVVTGIPDVSSSSGSASGGSTSAGVAVWTYGDAGGTVSKMLTSYK